MKFTKKSIVEALPVALIIVAAIFFVLIKLDLLSVSIPIRQQNKDLDLDGYVSSNFGGDDCNDRNASINPGAQDIPDDGIDQNCDSEDGSIAGAIIKKDDLDGDGFLSLVDCDDTDKNVNPDGKEIFNLIDDNCKDGIDEGFNSITLLKNFVIPNYFSDTIIKSSKGIVSSGKIKEAYLYVKAGVDTPLRPLIKYDSIYLYFDLPETSGHLVRSESLNTGALGDNLTTLVYNLAEVPFTDTPYQEGKINKTKNLLSLLNEGGQYSIGAFVATERYGQIVELVIAFRGGSIRLR